MTGGVVVVGSANIDHVIRVRHLPRPGESVLGADQQRHFGGKGANQAVAAARMGADVAFIGAVGDDEAGTASLAALDAEGVDTSHVRRIPGAATGTAFIVVDADGENQITVAAGANAQLAPADVAGLASLQPRAVLAVLEVPMDCVLAAARAARSAGAIFVVDPAPGQRLPDELLALHPFLTPNAGELRRAAALPGDAPEEAAILSLLDRGALGVLVTRGADGVTVATAGLEPYAVAGRRPPSVIDSTGAGDTFAGVFAAIFAERGSLLGAVEAANAAAALSVAGMGARGGMPTRGEFEAFLRLGE